jgi:ketosteroid isomerase-like protein
MSQANVEVVRRIYRAFARGDTAELFAATHPEITCHDRPSHPIGKVFHGHAGLLAMIKDDMETVDGLCWEPRQFMEIGDRVLVRVHQSGRGKSSGAPVEGDVIMLWTVEGGRTTELRIYATEHDALEAVGLSE